jgi:anthranilate synthase component II
MKILIIDNYDSFTYNLVHLVRTVGDNEPVVLRNDCFAMEDVATFDKIILSPGPGIPQDAGLMMQLLENFSSEKSILGICLGHQAIGCLFGAKLTNMKNVVHGKATSIKLLAPDNIFEGLGNNFQAGRYHSWVVDNEEFPAELDITAVDPDGFIMAMKHKAFDVKGVQFHPESIMTPCGEKIIQNWLKS